MATIARAVPPWLHRVCIRDHGPSADKIQMLLLYALNAFMNDDGSCFPGQDKIARASGLGVSTVRRETGEACEAGWIARVPRAAYEGQHWKNYAYRCCVPDSIDLSAIKVKGGGHAGKVADDWEGEHGKIDPQTLTKTWFPQPGKRRAPPRAGGAYGVEAPPADARSTARSDAKHRPLTLEAPPACGLEVPILSSNEVSIETQTRVRARARETMSMSDINIVSSEKTKAAEPEAREVRADRIRKAIKAWPDFTDGDIAKMVTGATVEEVQEVRRKGWNGASTTVVITVQITGVGVSGQSQSTVGVGIVGTVSTDTEAAANEGRMQRGEVRHIHGGAP